MDLEPVSWLVRELRKGQLFSHLTQITDGDSGIVWKLLKRQVSTVPQAGKQEIVAPETKASHLGN